MEVKLDILWVKPWPEEHTLMKLYSVWHCVDSLDDSCHIRIWIYGLFWLKEPLVKERNKQWKTQNHMMWFQKTLMTSSCSFCSSWTLLSVMRLILWEFLTHIQGNIDNIFYICKMFCCLLGVLSLNMYIYNIWLKKPKWNRVTVIVNIQFPAKRPADLSDRFG